MLISDYSSSNIIIFILCFDLIHFRELGQMYKYILIQFLVQMKTSKFAFEMNWPLSCNLKKKTMLAVLFLFLQSTNFISLMDFKILISSVIIEL